MCIILATLHPYMARCQKLIHLVLMPILIHSFIPSFFVTAFTHKPTYLTPT